ncbi:hypothetical protein [Moorena sp. SIO4G3]|nr:hypothetical protein [Moorena sp. SIO4G3]
MGRWGDGKHFYPSSVTLRKGLPFRSLPSIGQASDSVIFSE